MRQRPSSEKTVGNYLLGGFIPGDNNKIYDTIDL